MVNAGRPRRWAHIWQWEGCTPRPAPPLPPLLSRKCISARAEGEEAAGAGGSDPPRAGSALHPGAGRATTGGCSREGKAAPGGSSPAPEGTATAWRGFGRLVSCCFPACCCPRLRGARPAPAPTDVCRRTPRRHCPSTMLPAPCCALLSALPRATREQKADSAQEGLPPRPRCVRCCEPPDQRFSYPQYQPLPQINMTILKGEKGDRGERGMQGKFGKTGVAGSRGHAGPKGQKGSVGAPGERCKSHYAAFSVGRKKPLHSNDYYQTLIFDTEFVNLYDHFNMFTGKFYCYVPGIYYFSLNVHTWNQKETYLHIMRNGAEVVILYAQVSDRSIMQSQSVMLELREQDEVWVRLYKGERENAVFSDEYDTYITFSGHLIKYSGDP
ncbi:complement C1q tumor necrosis factor-related protein 1 isoform 1-T1 [Sarcoramphus papa]